MRGFSDFWIGRFLDRRPQAITVVWVSKRWIGLALVALLFCPTAADARLQSEYRHSFDQVWNAALRMVRVDLRLPITDKDLDAGYLLFDYLDHGKPFPGSIELVRGERDRRPVTRAVVQVQGMPAYVEQMLVDRLARKLREEYGEPIEPPKAPPKPAAPKEEEKKPDDEAPSAG